MSEKEIELHPHLQRQMDILPINILRKPITVIGAGAIGSMSVLCLAKMGFENITVFDHDEVNDVNLNAQFYRFKDIGKKKVEALKEIVADFSTTKIEAIPEMYDGKQIFSGIVVTAVDSMEARKTIWSKYAGKAPNTSLYVDPRMAIEYFASYAMNPMSPEDIEAYEKTLHSDEDSIQERCTGKSIMYTSQFAGGRVAQIVKDFLTTKRYPRVTLWNIAESALEAWYVGGGEKKK